MFTADWDYTPSEPQALLVTCDYCGHTYEWGILANHPQSECLEIQAVNEEDSE